MVLFSSSPGGISPPEGTRLASPAEFNVLQRPMVSPLTSLILGQRALLFNFPLKKEPRSATPLPSVHLGGREKPFSCSRGRLPSKAGAGSREDQRCCRLAKIGIMSSCKIQIGPWSSYFGIFIMVPCGMSQERSEVRKRSEIKSEAQIPINFF